MSNTIFPEGYTASDLKISIKSVISNLQSFVDNLEDYSSLKNVQDAFKASLTFSLQSFSSITQNLEYKNSAEFIKDIFPEKWVSSSSIRHISGTKTTYPLLSQITDDSYLIWQQLVANVHPKSSTMKWPNMYNRGDKWGTRNTKGTSTTVSYPGLAIRKMMAKLPPIHPVRDSLVKGHKYSGYIDHIKTGPFYGPYLFSNCYAIMQGKFVEYGTCLDYGWRVMIKEESIEFNEMDNDDYIGFRREVYPRVAIDSDYTEGSKNSKKIRFWYLDESDELQCLNLDYSQGKSKPPGFDCKSPEELAKQKAKGDDDSDSDSGSGGMGGMFE